MTPRPPAKGLRLLVCSANVLLSIGSCRGQGVSVAKHPFHPPQRRWLLEVDYLQEDGPASYIVVKPADRDPGIKTYHKEICYYWNPQERAAGRTCKVLRFNPHGWREEEIDNIGPDQYSREFYPSGSVSSSLHWYGPDGVIGKWLDGDSVSPVKKKVSHFAHGRGALTAWNSDAGDEGTYARTWYLDGDTYLTKRVVQNKCTGTTLYAPHDDSLSVGPQEETLTLTSLHELWIKRRGQQPFAQIMGAADLAAQKNIRFDVTHDPVKVRIRQAWPLVIHNMKRNRRNPDGDDQRSALLAQLAQDYAARRATFLVVYGAQLPRAGQNWKSLGLESITEGTP